MRTTPYFDYPWIKTKSKNKTILMQKQTILVIGKVVPLLWPGLILEFFMWKKFFNKRRKTEK